MSSGLVAGGIYSLASDCGNESSSDGHRSDSMKSGINVLNMSFLCCSVSCLAVSSNSADSLHSV